MKVLLSLMLGAALCAPAWGDSLLDPGTANLLGQRPLVVGDLVTVVITDKVQNSQTVDIKSNTGATFDGPVGTGGLGQLLPGIGMKSNGGTTRSESAVSTSQFNHTITAHVVKVEGGSPGVLVLEAHNSLDFDGKVREVTLKGRVRRQDVQADNTVTSDKVCETELVVDGAQASPVDGGFLNWVTGFLR